ncbi:MAG: hypothetical protein ACI9DQ_000244, partial [Glaciecola sp.]
MTNPLIKHQHGDTDAVDTTNASTLELSI